MHLVSAPRQASRSVLLGFACGVALVAVACSVGVSVPPSAPRGALDQPEDGASIEMGTLTSVSGWAVDLGARGTTGVNRVQLYVDGTPAGDADYGQTRTDIAASFGSQFSSSGWTAHLDPSALAPGPHTVEARAISTLTGEQASYAHTLTIMPPASTIVGAVDVPEEGASVSGLIDVRGWAIDQASGDGTGIDRITLYLDGTRVADASYGLVRAEIGNAYGDRFRSCGWSARLDTRGWSAGPHVLEARPDSRLSSVATTYRRTVVVQPE